MQLASFTKMVSACQCPRKALARLYSTPVSRDAMRKWRVSDAQKPRSILDDDDSSGPLDLSEDEDLVNGGARNPDLPPIHKRRPPKEPTPEYYAKYRSALSEKFPDGWNPARKISREAMDGLRRLHQTDSERFNVPVLADQFKISPEAVRKILKSRWAPSSERSAKMMRKERDYYAQKNIQERKELEGILRTKKREAETPGRGDAFSFE
jgi:hypothetical protein